MEETLEGLQLETFLTWIGRLAGLLGVLLITVAVVRRAGGAYFLGGFQLGTLLLAGMAAMLVACLGYLIVLVEYRRK